MWRALSALCTFLCVCVCVCVCVVYVCVCGHIKAFSSLYFLYFFASPLCLSVQVRRDLSPTLKAIYLKENVDLEEPTCDFALEAEFPVEATENAGAPTRLWTVCCF